MPNVKHAVNAGLHQTATPDHFLGPAEGDLWYNNETGNVRTRVVALVSPTGPSGMTPHVYDIANGWYSILPGGGIVSSEDTVNGIAYAYPFYPGRKCVLSDFAMRIFDVPGTGNLRMMLYGALPSGLPGALIADYGTKGTLTVNTTISGWTVGTVLQPALYYIVLAVQTSGIPPSLISRTFISPVVPSLQASSPSALTSGVPRSFFYTVTGFGGAPPATFGAATSGTFGPPPFIYVKLTQ